MSIPSTANDLRRAFTGYFAERGHSSVESASLIPHDPTVLFTVAGMVPFKPYFVGDEVPPFSRAATVQKCARAGGKHNELDDVGRTKRHLVFFEMLGHFSFGDYFKESAIPWSWELVTERLGFDGDRIWVTVHTSDDEAEAIWHEQVGVPMDRIQRLGDKDNFWQMGDTGPCGPCSELHIDRGPAFGPPGGPLNDPHGDRFMEFWNLVFMQYNQAPDGTRTLLPKPSIDTGAGLERILALVQGKDSVWETDALYPLVETAQSVTGTKYVVGDYEDRSSFSLRVLAEHARSSTMLVADGVFPSNEGRGYVLRRIIRRAVRHAFLLGTDKLVMPRLVETAIDVMGEAYPDVVRQKDFVLGVLTKEEERFRQTLTTGLGILSDEMAVAERESRGLSGSTAFLLHDTYGFPLEVTQEIAAEKNMAVDIEGFEHEMSRQRERAKAARKNAGASEDRLAVYREILEESGQTSFVGYESEQCVATVVAVVDVGDGSVEVFLDTTPFYAESGGQVGDTGRITGPDGVLDVVDTTFALPGLRRHSCRVVAGDMSVGQQVEASIDRSRRTAIRRHHTATHVLHWAVRETLGDHVKQAGSLVDDRRLRFDFSHYAVVTDEQIARIEEMANSVTLGNTRVSSTEMDKEEATARGAIAFFGDKYGDRVRVLEAGPSVELCGGTHVSATGDIGVVKIVSESSIGANLRRIEAVAGVRTLVLVREQESILNEASRLVGIASDQLIDGIGRKLDDIKALTAENKGLRGRVAVGRASEISSEAVEGVVVARVDGLAPAELRELTLAVRAQNTIRAVVLVGVSSTGGVSMVAATAAGFEVAAADLIRGAAKAVGGGGGGKGDVVTAGGKNVDGIDEAIRLAREAARI
ncbi:MAG: alanine--tRNA ligase [Actinomycetota bacterium]